MPMLSEQQLLYALLAVATILVIGRAGGEIAHQLQQPEVLGELLAGFLLGPSVLGALVAPIYHTLFTIGPTPLILSGLSWMGAILLLLVAGMEIDLGIIRQEALPGGLAAFAIVPSLAAGTLFSWRILDHPLPDAFFLGIVLSVTGVSVAAKILMEQGVLRRRFGQIILAAGVTSEVIVWLFIAVVSSFHHPTPTLGPRVGASPLFAGVRSAFFATAFFIFMLTIGRRFTFWAMRRVADRTQLAKGQLSLVLVLTFFAAAITQALGLHALLGAFVFGVLLSRAPRANNPFLGDRLQTLVVGLFAPIFFVLAGMRVDIFQLGSGGALLILLLLFLVATTVKVSFGALAARLGGLTVWEAGLVGVGLNLKGGTDVIVAILGTELGLLTARAYTMYAVVAILTVFISPGLLAALERRAPLSTREEERLVKEEAERRSYLPRIERVLVPVAPQLLSSLAASVVERLAASKHEQDQILDITELKVEEPEKPLSGSRAHRAARELGQAGQHKDAELVQQSVAAPDALETILKAAQGHDLLAIGARPPKLGAVLSLGRLQDTLIDQTKTDVLVAIDRSAKEFNCSQVHHILVPTNGLEYSLAAGDVAGAIAQACDAELCIFHVVQSTGPEGLRPGRGEGERRTLVETSVPVVDELEFRLTRLGARVSKEVRVSIDPGQAIVEELQRHPYDLIVLGGTDRGRDDRLYLGPTIQTILTGGNTPAILLISHRRSAEKVEAA